ncbi:MAG: hypothetical protein AB1778_10385 [Candidatus Bipolaricaulota bacterium]
MSTHRVPSAEVSRFAGEDLARWRAFSGAHVTARDARWGNGCVLDVLWEGRSDDPTPRGAIYLKVEYADGLSVRVNAAAFAQFHTSVEVSEELDGFLEAWRAAEAGDEEARRALAGFDRELRAAQDAARGARAAALRERVRDRA